MSARIGKVGLQLSLLPWLGHLLSFIASPG